jgi:hypothetical protein
LTNKQNGELARKGQNKWPLQADISKEFQDPQSVVIQKKIHGSDLIHKT